MKNISLGWTLGYSIFFTEVRGELNE